MKTLWRVLATVAILVILITSISQSRTHTVAVTIRSHYWGMRVSIETIQPVEYKRQERMVAPPGAYNDTCYSESGYYGKLEPGEIPPTVHYCDYTVDEWRHFRYATAYGTDFLPVWQQPVLNPGEVVNAGSFEELYTIEFTDEQGIVYTYHPENVGEYQNFNGALNIVITVDETNDVRGYEFYNKP